jgi:DNA-binding MarR family transcriptional regulator
MGAANDLAERDRTGRERTEGAGAKTPIRLDRFLPYRLSLLAGHLALPNADLQTEDHRLSVQEWKVMAIIADSEPVTPVEIRRHGTQDKSTISWAIKRMVDQGLLVKRPAPADGRTFEVLMSDAGWRFYRTVAPKARQRARDIFKALDAAELKELGRLVDKLLPD